VSRLRLRIGPVIQNAEDVRKRVERELPTHIGLLSLAAGVATAARDAERIAQRLQRPFGLHRLPAAFLVLAMLILIFWVYVQFFRTTTLRIALPDRDFQALKSRMMRAKGLRFTQDLVPGSREVVQKVEAGEVDLGLVQGGVEIPEDLPRFETQYPELVFWFTRQTVPPLGSVRRILTSVKGSGSHTVAMDFMRAWKLESQVEFVHDWTLLSGEKKYSIAEDIDAVFVVKDPADPQALRAAERLSNAGFMLQSLDLGARATQLDYLLNTHIVPAGYLVSVPPFPNQPVSTYSVKTYLIARKDITPRMLAAASHLLDGDPGLMSSGRYEPNLGEASELFQGVDAFLGIIINLVLAFLALTGLEMMAYRKRFHELNSLVSLISIHQSSKDVLGVNDARTRRDHLLYLSLCSDLLGLVSMIGGYYTQENSSLLFSGLPEIIHQRCDGLKINIQLKILHATIDTKPFENPVPATEPSPPNP